MRSFLAMPVFACLLTGCASAGTRVTSDQLAQFTKGTSTESEVIAALGEPNSTSTLPDGQKVDTYVYVRTSADAIDFVPVVGLLAGGASSRTSSTAFYFNANGLMTGTSGSSSSTNVASGLLNQH